MLNIPITIKKILYQRNLQTEKEMQDFLYPKLSMLPSPNDMKGVGDAAKILCDCILSDTEIIIWGDYDVDGTTGTSLLVNFLRELGVEASWHIPNRLEEGYGLNGTVFREKFEEDIENGFLLVTVDCGISDSTHVGEINALGGKVIVTDHHQLPLGETPDCIVVNPSQEDCGFNDQKLAGVGVAFYLAAAVRDRLTRLGYFENRQTPNMKKYLGFVALGTIADLVEMTSTNRILVRGGIESLAETTIPGLRAILRDTGIDSGPITTEDVSFGIGPRINAAGRLGKAEAAVGLMTCDNMTEGERFSRSLEQYNVERRRICEDCFKAALTSLEVAAVEDSPAICVAGEYHVGVVGIVASKIVEKYNKPTIVFSKQAAEDGSISWKGSGRSIEGVSIIECLHQCSGKIVKYGGHAMAAGLTVEGALYCDFEKLFANSVKLSVLNSAHDTVRNVQNLFEASVDEVMDKNFLEYLSAIEPFGPQNEQPVFVDKNAQVVNCKTIGADGRHLQLTFRGKYANYRGVAFGFGDKLSDIKKQRKRELHFVPMMNRFRGSASWRVRVVSI